MVSLKRSFYFSERNNMKKQTATAAEVRAWAAKQPWTDTPAFLAEGARGRVPAKVIQQFETANPTKKYAKPTKVQTLPVPHENSKGVISIRQTSLPTSEVNEVRHALGLGKRGRLSKGTKDEPGGLAQVGAAFARLK